MSRGRARRDVAVVGMAGRFPGAPDLGAFWRNLRDGVESIVPLAAEDLAASGVDQAMLGQPGYVAAGAPLEDVELFDADFFGYSPREAESIDPQQRLFLQTAWHALEDAGYDPGQDDRAVGVYAGCATSSYVQQLYANPQFMAAAGGLQTLIGNDKDYLTTRVAYKLDLTGPAIGVQTACSTGLVAVVVATQALLDGDCHVALAGAVTVRVPHRAGYWHLAGGIYAPDGHCRAFGAHAEGTVFGSGLGIVVLKRLEDAIADRDHVRAVIRGTALNNDGALKVGFTAPSLQGQAEVIATAQAVAGVDPSTIDYVEAHGTGTALGDPIEVEALTQAFQEGNGRSADCALGSVKSNVGHLDPAAGIAGFIKSVLQIEHGELVPTLHCEPPNPAIPFDRTPFHVNTTLRRWPKRRRRRRSGVSAFGIGGTNAHVVLEQAPGARPDARRRSAQLLTLSAATPTALQRVADRLAGHLEDHPEADLADVAYTTQVGRRALPHRRAVMCADAASAVAALRSGAGPPAANGGPQERCVVAFLFSGQGTQHPGMAADVYRDEPVFAEALDRCAQSLAPRLGLDLRELVAEELPDSEREAAAEQLRHTSVTQPALFAVEYALAQLLGDWGLEPGAMIGHSVGEYVAACLAGVLSLDDALAVVAERGRLVGGLPGGAMLAVPKPEQHVEPLLGPDCGVAAINERGVTIVSGSAGAIAALEAQLDGEGLASRRLHTSHAFHSPAMEPAVEPLTELMASMSLAAPRIPYVSNVTGDWVTAEQAGDPASWGRHLRNTVRFADGLGVLFERASALVEIGPGATLAAMARRHPARAGRPVVPTLPGPRDEASAAERLLDAVGTLWYAGATPRWARLHAGHHRRRLPLPHYPFEGRRYWVEASAPASAGAAPVPAKRSDPADRFAVPRWRPAAMPAGGTPPPRRTYLVFDEERTIGAAVAEHVRARGARAVTVVAREGFERLGRDAFAVDPAAVNDVGAVVDVLTAEDGVPPDAVAHLWSVTASEDPAPNVAAFRGAQARGFHAVVALATALNSALSGAPRIDVVVAASGLHDVTGGDAVSPAKATLLGPVRSAVQESPQLVVRCVDVQPGAGATRLAERLVAELDAEPAEAMLAYRGDRRLALGFEPVRLQLAPPVPSILREGGVYVITGGLGNVGYHLAEALARHTRAKLVLIGRSGLPARRTWDARLAASVNSHDPVARRIRRVRQLEALGGTVMVRVADVRDPEALRRALDAAEARFGPINGIVHGAGDVDPNDFASVDELDAGVVERHFAPKAEGLLYLEDAMTGRSPVDFWMLVSSLSAVLGGLGFSAYAAANAFLDAYAVARRSADDVRWLSVDWDAWDFAHPHPPAALSAEEGQEAFLRIAADPSLTQVAVSATPLQRRLDRWTDLRSVCAGVVKTDATRADAHARPGSAGSYVEPRDGLEKELAAIWQELLGVERVGSRDEFFTELGGHSLLATQLVSQLRARYRLELPLRTFFDAATVEQLAVAMTALQSRQAEADGLPEPPPIRRAARRAVLSSDGELRLRS